MNASGLRKIPPKECKTCQKMAKILPNIVATPVVLQFAYLTQPSGIQPFFDFLQSIFCSCMIFASNFSRLGL